MWWRSLCSWLEQETWSNHVRINLSMHVTKKLFGSIYTKERLDNKLGLQTWWINCMVIHGLWLSSPLLPTPCRILPFFLMVSCLKYHRFMYILPHRWYSGHNNTDIHVGHWFIFFLSLFISICSVSSLAMG